MVHKRSSSPQPALDTFREKIDRIDAQLLTLLNRRAHLAQQIGNTKGKTDPVYIPGRERAILARLAELNTGPLPDESVQAIYREIISASRALEMSLRVAYLGPEASYAHMASKEQFGSKAEFVSVETIPQIFSAVENGQTEYGVVPVENSSQGSVALTLDLFIETNLHIIAERSLAIRHCLLSRATKRERIQRVLAHPQSLAQCQHWLATHMPGVPTEAAASNSRAAELVRRDPHAAAIAGRLAAERYRLNIIDADIQDQAANYTRFAILSRTWQPGTPSGDDKTSLVLSVRDEPGVLYQVLRPFAAHSMSLLRIESRPLKGRPWEYVFFIDVEGHVGDPALADALREIEPCCMSVKVLGSYTSFGSATESARQKR